MKRVLIVDDSLTSRMQIEKLAKNFAKFAKEKFEFIKAKSGPDAISKLKDAGSIDLAILDFNMKGMNGIELAEQICDKIDYSNMILCTANIQQATYDKSAMLGIRLMEKPVNYEKVRDSIGEVLGLVDLRAS